MKKRRFIAGVLALSMLLMGTGYAYWTDALTISTTAGTGKLGVKFLDTRLYGYYGDEDGWSIVNGIGSDSSLDGDDLFDTTVLTWKGHRPTVVTLTSDQVIDSESAGYTLARGSVKLDPATQGTLGTDYAIPGAYPSSTLTSDGLSIDLNYMYPGYAQIFRSDIANVGTLAAKLSSVKAEVTGDSAAAKSMLGIAIFVQREYSTTDPNPTIVDVYKSLSTADTTKFFQVGGVTFLRLAYLNELNTFLNAATIANENDLLYIKPDKNRMDVYFAVAMDPDSVGQFTTGKAANYTSIGSYTNGKVDGASQLTESTITVQFLWDQFNVGKDTTDGNVIAKEQ